MIVGVACALAAGCGGDDGSPVDASPADAAVDTAVDAAIDAVGTCTVDGVYSTLIKEPVYFRFDATTHTWAAALTEAELATPIIDGTFTFAGSTFTIVEAPGHECPETQTGTYTAAFSPTCDFTLTLVDEPCTERGDSLDGRTFTFLHP